MPFYKACFLLFFLCRISVSYSQDFIYKHYDLQDGLASPTIHSIFQDRDGFLWFGTESGLCRYDGTRFKTFTVKDGLNGNEVFEMKQDRKGRIWLRQYKNSISYIYNGKIYNQENDSLLKKIKLKTRLFGIAEDEEGNIGLCDTHNLYIISNDYKTVRVVQKTDKDPEYIVGLYKDREKGFRICSQWSLYKVEDFQYKYIKTLTSIRLGETAILLHPNYIPCSIDDSTMLVFLKDTTIRYKLFVHYPIKYSAISDSVFSVNTIDGALLFNIHTLRGMRVLPGVKVSNVLIDTENNLWLGTMDKGVYKISSRSIINRKISEGGNEISYIGKVANKLIIGNSSAQVYEYEGGKFVNIINSDRRMGKIHYYEKTAPGECISANVNEIASYKNGVQKNGIYLIGIKQVISLNAHELLLATHAGLYITQKKDFRVIDTARETRTLCAFMTGDSLLTGTSAGLFVLKKKNTTGRRWFIADSLLTSSIIAFIAKTTDNLIWVSTYEDGLYYLKDGKIAGHFTDTTGLPSNNGRSLHVKGNDVWLGTDRGLVKISRHNNDFRFQKYSTSEGLPSDNINSIYVDGDTVYVGTPEGLCYFDETKIETTSVCNLVLTGIKIGDSTVAFSDKYFIRRNQRFVTEFSGISFRSEKEITYRYRIHGIDEDWRTTSINSLEFTSLPYGDYELEILAINKFGKVSLPLKVKFSIIRPFHKTLWFTLLVALVAVSIILFLYSRWLNFRKHKQLQKLQQDIKLLQLEQMALQAQMNPHFIFNCLNAMQHLILENDVDNANRFLTSFASLVRQTLNNAPELFISLHEEVKFLGSYFELERIRMEDQFSYIIDTASVENTGTLYVPNMVIQPFAENAIKHGILYKKDGKGFVEVKFTQEESKLRCTVTDNGIGREKAEQMKMQSGYDYASKGMGITIQRIESLNTLMSGKISIVVHDLKDDKGKALGTRVVIDFL